MPDAPATNPGDGSPAAEAPQSRPRPSAAAASRARRIGGRAVPAASSRAGVDSRPAHPITAAAPADPVAPGKPASGPAPSRRGASEPAPARRSRARDGAPAWLVWLPATVLTIASLLAVILLVVASHGVWWGRASDTAARQEVLAAAKTCVSKANTYKYTDLDTYERDGLKCATGVYTGQFRQAVEKIIKKNAPTLKAVQSTQINTAAIEAVTKSGQWSVLIFGQIKVTNANYPNGRTDPFGAVVRMEKVGGKWLISGLKTVSSPVSNGG